MNPIAYTVKQENGKVENKVKVTERTLSYMQYTYTPFFNREPCIKQRHKFVSLFVCLFSVRFWSETTVTQPFSAALTLHKRIFSLQLFTLKRTHNTKKENTEKIPNEWKCKHNRRVAGRKNKPPEVTC